MMTTINYFPDDEVPDALYWHYSGQHQRQPVYLWVDTRDGEIGIDYQASIGGVPEAIYDGTIRTVELPVVPTPAGANAILDRIQPAVEAWYGAWQAVTELHCPICRRDGADETAWTDLVNTLQDDDWYDLGDLIAIWPDDAITDDWIDGYTLAGATDDDIDRYAADILDTLACEQGYGHAVCDGLVSYMRQVRDEQTAVTA